MALFEGPAGADSSFRAQLEADSLQVFLNPEEFGERRSVRYDGTVYEDIPVVLAEGGELERHNTRIMKTDHAQSLYKSKVRLFCRAADLGGKTPEFGAAVELESRKKNGFWLKYTVESAARDEGVVDLLLRKVDE